MLIIPARNRNRNRNLVDKFLNLLESNRLKASMYNTNHL